MARDLTEVVVDGQRWRLFDTGAGTEVVVLLHPIGLDAGWWRPHVEVLSDRYRVLAVDLPGHGGTEVALPYSFRAAGAGIARLLDELGITRDVTAVGVSMGGMIAPWVALHSSAVTSLLLVATAASFPPEARAAIRSRAAAVEELGMAGLAEQTLQRWFSPALLAAGDPLVARARTTLEAADPRVHAACWRAIAELDAREVLGGLPLPTTVLAGEADASLPLARAEELVALLPQGRLEVHAGGSHLFAFEGHDWLLPALERTGSMHDQPGAPASGPERPPQPLPDLERAIQVVDTSGEGPTLLGSRCRHCSLAAFPAREVCSGCGGDQLDGADLGAVGTLYTFAAVHVASGRPTPYTLGYVDLPSGPRVLARIEADEAVLAVDQRVELHLDETGWAFRPATSGEVEA